MTTTQIIILISVVTIIVVLASRFGGPRVTEITSTRRRERDHDDA